jgi:hypothetical protein
MKKIMVEMWLEDDFTPPDYLEEPCRENNWKSKCTECSFHSWNDDYGILECHFCGEWEEAGELLRCPIKKYYTEKAQATEQFRDCGGIPCGGSMYEIYSMFDEYDEISMTAMELVLTEGPDALMRQLNYDNIELIKTFPAICKKAIELGILTEEELGDREDEEE